MSISFQNTEIAYAALNNFELYKSYLLFKAMNYNWLIKTGANITTKLLKYKLPIQPLIKTTIFEHFCGGETLQDLNLLVQKLQKFNVKIILDYGVEAKDNEQEFDNTVNELINAILYAKTNPTIPAISCKITGFANFDLLQKIHLNQPLSQTENIDYEKIKTKLHTICATAQQAGIMVYIDSEESWIQQPLDDLITLMMQTYNTTKPIVFNTFQLYRTNRLQYLYQAHQHALTNNYILGAKLVRGAYMEKERERAQKLNYTSPIHANKQLVDNDFNQALQFCVNNINTVAMCCASHNEYSTNFLTELIQKNQLPKNHPHLYFAQLFGMSDNLTYNLSKNNYNAAKYLPYGPVKEVIPYLIRRANENTSVAGQSSRELQLIVNEIKRRKMWFI